MASSDVGSSQNKAWDQNSVCKDKDSFRKWLSGQLQYYNADDEVFLPYIMSILEEAEDSSSQSDDVLDSLSDILEGLGLDEDCDNQENSLHLKKEIWTKWNKATSLEISEGIQINGDGAAGGANEKVDLQTQLAKITESRSEAYKASTKAAAERQNERDEEERKAVKAAILAQYQNQGEEVSEDSDEDNKGKEDELSAMRNENKEAVAKAENEKRERCRAAALAKKEKDKEDREKQKKDQEERKKKANDKASKGERKR